MLGYNGGIVYSCGLDATNGRKIDFRHEEAVTSIDAKGDSILIGTLDKTASLWVGKRRYRSKLDKKFIGHSDALCNVSFVKGTNYMVSSDEEGHVKLWDLTPTYASSSTISGTSILNIDSHSDTSVLVAFRARRDRDKIGTLYELNNNLEKVFEHGQTLRRNADNKDHLVAFDYTKDGTLVIAAGSNNLITTASGQDGEQIRLTNIKEPINDIQIVNNGIYIATSDGILHCKDIYNSIIEYDTLVTGHRVNALAYSTTHGVLATARNDHKVLLYEDNVAVDSLTFHSNKVADVEFSESDTFLVTGGWDNRMIVWHKPYDKWRKLGSPHRHQNDVVDVAFSGDSLILSASRDRTVQLYSIDNSGNHKRIPSLIRHPVEITAAAFHETPDGLHVVSGDLNGVVRSWNVADFDSILIRKTHDALDADKANFERSKELHGNWKLVSRSSAVKRSFPCEIKFDYSTFKEITRIWQPERWGNGSYDVPRLDSIIFKTGTGPYRYQFSMSGDTLQLIDQNIPGDVIYLRR